MILVADSGSTKTTWAIVGSDNKVVTEGLNPHFSTDEAILAACGEVRVRAKLGEVDTEGGRRSVSVFFYGAGCGNATQSKRVKLLLQKSFETEDVHVETDMLGACRAVSGDRGSLMAILGTGSNICCYDGSRITCQPFSTGYVLGDYGSANHVGRKLLDDYLTHRMPFKERRLFHDAYKMSDAKLMDAVYHQPNPNRFLASLAPFAVGNMEWSLYCELVLRGVISDWYLNYLLPISHRAKGYNGEVNFVGGFAKAIEPLLREHLKNDFVRVGDVVADPMEGLLKYHEK